MNYSVNNDIFVSFFHTNLEDLPISLYWCTSWLIHLNSTLFCGTFHYKSIKYNTGNQHIDHMPVD